MGLLGWKMVFEDSTMYDKKVSQNAVLGSPRILLPQLFNSSHNGE